MQACDASPRKVLIVRPSALGDVARSVAALVSVKRAWPDAEVDWLVRDVFAEAVSGHPDLHGVVAFPRGEMDGFWRSPAKLRRVLAYCGALKRRRYDVAVDLQGLGRSGVFTWATRAKRRYGPGDARELAWLGYTHRVGCDGAGPHTVDRMLAVVEAAGAKAVRDMRLYPPAEAEAWAEGWFAERGIDGERCVVVAPTAKWASKRWPIERFDAVLGGLGERGFDAAVVIGGPGEAESTAMLTAKRDAKPRRFDVVGKTGVGQMMAVIAKCGLVMANDSAALHIAMGLGRRAVGVFGPTDPAAVGPYRYEIGVARPAGDAAGTTAGYRNMKDDQTCIGGVSVARVMETVDRVLGSPPPATLFDAESAAPPPR